MFRMNSLIKDLANSIQDKNTTELIKRKWRTIYDKFKRKRQKEYVQLATDNKEVLSKIFPKDNFEAENFLELEAHLNEFISNKNNEVNSNKVYPMIYNLDKSFCRFLFFLSIYTKPDLVIETGIANGFSSSYILLALNQINRGNLVSFDYLFKSEQTIDSLGNAIPNYLKNRHNIILGDATKELKKFFSNNKAVDIFLHDSEHTYKHMMEEFQIVWPYIKNNGFLLSDDVSNNDAFLDFANKVGKIPNIIFGDKGNYFGLIQK